MTKYIMVAETRVPVTNVYRENLATYVGAVPIVFDIDRVYSVDDRLYGESYLGGGPIIELHELADGWRAVRVDQPSSNDFADIVHWRRVISERR